MFTCPTGPVCIIVQAGRDDPVYPCDDQLASVDLVADGVHVLVRGAEFRVDQSRYLADVVSYVPGRIISACAERTPKISRNLIRMRIKRGTLTARPGGDGYYQFKISDLIALANEYHKTT